MPRKNVTKKSNGQGVIGGKKYNRQRVYEAVCIYPGANSRTISRVTLLALSTTSMHLAALMKEGKVERRGRHKDITYYAIPDSTP